MNKLFFTLILLIVLTTFISGEEIMQKEINLSKLTIDEKIGQLMIVKPIGLDTKYLEELNVGGIFLNDLKTKDNYSDTINFYQNNSKIPLFVATDMEGYWNPFSFYKGKSFGEITNSSEAYNLGKEQGKLLSEIGFNLDFSPVVEIRNNVWPGRSFTGTNEEISEKISNYIKGLQSEEILATAKHYPGGNLVKNPHLFKFKVEADKDELDMFQVAFDSGVDAVMTGHPIVYGELDSNGKQVTVSKEVISDLEQKFDGLIVTDAVTMLGLRWSYFWNFKKVYPDLIRAGNNIILDTHIHSGYKRLVKRRNELRKQALEDPTLMQRIDSSVKKVLENKGYVVTE